MYLMLLRINVYNHKYGNIDSETANYNSKKVHTINTCTNYIIVCLSECESMHVSYCAMMMLFAIITRKT